MKYLGNISDPKDLVTKEYVDGKTYSKSDVGLGNVDNVQQYSASNPPPYPVTSVNGQTGVVMIVELPSPTASDNGKFVTVVNGAYSLVAVPDANGRSF